MKGEPMQMHDDTPGHAQEDQEMLYKEGEYARAAHWLNEDLEELCKKHNLVQTPEKLASIMEDCDSRGLFDDAVDSFYDEIERIAVLVAKNKGRDGTQ